MSSMSPGSEYLRPATVIAGFIIKHFQNKTPTRELDELSAPIREKLSELVSSHQGTDLSAEALEWLGSELSKLVFDPGAFVRCNLDCGRYADELADIVAMLNSNFVFPRYRTTAVTVLRLTLEYVIADPKLAHSLQMACNRAVLERLAALPSDRKVKEDISRAVTAAIAARGEKPPTDTATDLVTDATAALPAAAKEIGSETAEAAQMALLQGKTAEAEEIFRKLADQKEREGSAAHQKGEALYREAADALRHLAAVTYLNDKAKALSVLERATKLAPNVVELLVEFGDVARDAGNLERAKNSYNSALRITEQNNDLREQGRMLDRLCTLMDMTGEKEQALTYSKAALNVAEKLGFLEPENLDRQRDLYMAINKIADAKINLNEPEHALLMYKKSHELRLRISDLYPDNWKYQRDLSQSYEKIGAALIATNKFVEALEAHENALFIRDRALKSNPDDVDWLALRSISLNVVGMTLVKLGDTTRAAVVLEEGIKVSQELVSKDLTNIRHQTLLVGMLGQYGTLKLELGEKSDARVHFLRAKAIVDQIRLKAPDLAQAKSWENNLIADLRRTEL